MIKRILLSGLLLGAIGPCLLNAQSGTRVSMTLRGQPQEIYAYPAAPSVAAPVKVLFLPGDAGWRGFAIDMAKAIAGQGYDVYGWDVRNYLMGFTGKTTLSETQMMADIHEVVDCIAQYKSERVLLAGWSQGAGMVVLAAAADDSEKFYRGVIAIGLPDSALLAWRRTDDLTYITKKEPKEPVFTLVPRMPEVAPLPLALIYSTNDQYITSQEAKKLYEAAREPKRYFEVAAKNHHFDGSQSDFFRTLGEAVRWVSLR